MVFGLILPLHSALAVPPPVVEADLRVVADGTTPFDGTTYDPVGDTNAGTDAAAANGIVRNSDVITYRMEANLNGTDSDNLTFTLTLSAEQEIIALPNLCLTSRASAALSPVSSISNDKTTLVCNTGILDEGTTARVDVLVRVKPTTPNGQAVTALLAATADDANTATTNSTSVIATGRPIYDLVQKVITSESGSYDYGSGLVGGSIVTWGSSMLYTKGSESLQNGTITLTSQITNTGVANTAVLLDCEQLGDVSNLPFGQINIRSEATGVNSVVDSGTISCDQPGGPGTDVIFTITSPELNPDSFPNLFADSASIPQGDSYVVSFSYQTFHPYTDVAVGGSMTITNVINSTAVPLSVSGQVASETTLSNNTGLYGMQYSETSGPTVGGALFGYIFPSTRMKDYTDYPVNELVNALYSTDQYVPGSEIPFNVYTAASHNNGLPSNGYTTTTATQIMCVKPDDNWEFTGQFRNTYMSYDANSRLDEFLAYYQGTGQNPLDSVYLTNFDPNFSFAAFAYTQRAGTGFTPKRTLLPVIVEYSFDTPASFKNSECSDTDATWVTDFGANPELVKQIRFMVTIPGETFAKEVNTVRLEANPIFRLKDSVLIGDFAGVWMSAFQHSNGSHDSPYVWTHSPATDDPSDPNYAFHAYNNSATISGLSHRVEMVDANVRVSKQVTTPAVGGGIKTTFASGETVQYRLTTELTVPNTVPSGTTTVVVQDLLPVGLEYNYDAVVTQGGPCTLNVQRDVPATGQTTLEWTCSNVSLNGLDTAAPIIEFSANVLSYIASGTYTNSVYVTSPIDTHSTTGQRTAAAAITVNTPGSFLVHTYAKTPGIEQNNNIVFALEYGNAGSVPVSATQFIDILPYVANPLEPASDFNGSLKFANITGTFGETYEFTLADPTTIELDPCHVSNVPLGETAATYAFCNNLAQLVGGSTGTGATQWCSLAGPFSDAAFAGLPVGCPQSLADVTAIRISGGTYPINQPRRTLDLTLSTDGNQLQDLYSNEFGGRAAEYALPVVSNDAIAEVVSGTIGDTVWLDRNNNGTQDSGETGIAGVTVNLVWAGSDGIFGNGDDEDYITVTSASGFYEFTGLPSGLFQVTVDAATLPTGLTQTYDYDGIATPHTAAVTLSQELNPEGVLVGVTQIEDADFGYFTPGSGTSTGSTPDPDPEDPNVPTVPPVTPPVDPGTPAAPGSDDLPRTGMPISVFITYLGLAVFVGRWLVRVKLSISDQIRPNSQ